MRNTALSAFYRLLASYLDAGVPMLRSLESLSRQVPRAMRQVTVGMGDDINHGMSFAEAVGSRPAVFPDLHREILLAGERSGHLPELLTRLADMLDAEQAQRRRLYTSLIYPGLVLHLGVFVLALSKAFVHFDEGGATIGFQALVFVRFLLLGLGPVYALGAAMAVSRIIARRSQSWRALGQAVLRLLPLLGKLHRQASLARWARALDALYAAGISLPKALPNAGEAGGDVVLARQVSEAAAAMDAGADPVDAFGRVSFFPVDVTAMLVTGVESGKLDQMLRQIAAKQEDEAATTARIVAVLTPVLAMLLIGGILVYFIISFFLQGYVQPMNELLGS